MDNKINMFIRPIIVKRHKYDFKSWYLKYKLTKIINSTSPSFDMMIKIHEFLLLLTDIYMYDNNKSFHLFLATIGKNHYKNNDIIAKAMIYKEEGFSIKFVLLYESDIDPDNDKKQINIEIQRNGQNKNDIERISFYDGQYKFKDVYDEEKMLFITSCLMNGVLELIEYFYKNKKL